ncbi:Putative F-box protein At3g49980 [Linum perenne]
MSQLGNYLLYRLNSQIMIILSTLGRDQEMKKNTISLPEDLIIDIQRKLPVSCMPRLCCVSKSWNSLLSNPNFVYGSLFYGDQNNNDEEENAADANAQIVITQFVKQSVYISLSYDTLLPIGDDRSVINLNSAVSKFTDHNPYSPPPLTLAGSCEGGLICLLSVPSYIGLFNPATNETKMLPPILPYLEFRRSRTGFALLDKQDEEHESLGWKELTLAGLNSELELSHEIPQYYSWRKKKKKYCYWLANYTNDKRCNLVSFDLITEVLQVEQVLPLTCDLVYNDHTVYMVDEETLVAVLNPAKEVCVLQRYLVNAGEDYSWQKLFAIELPRPHGLRAIGLSEHVDGLRAIGLSKHGKLICLETSQKKLQVIDVTKGENSTLPIEIPDRNYCLVQFINYVPSKMSLSSGAIGTNH